MPVFTHVPALAEAPVGFLSAKIVITSSWRDHKDIEQLRLLLAELGSRVVCVTRLMKDCRQSIRQREIEAWLSNHPEYTRLIVLDNMPELFEVGAPHLLVCDPRTGLDPSTLGKLIARLLLAPRRLTNKREMCSIRIELKIFTKAPK
jgi:hypothetical protein